MPELARGVADITCRLVSLRGVADVTYRLVSLRGDVSLVGLTSLCVPYLQPEIVRGPCAASENQKIRVRCRISQLRVSVGNHKDRTVGGIRTLFYATFCADLHPHKWKSGFRSQESSKPAEV